MSKQLPSSDGANVIVPPIKKDIIVRQAGSGWIAEMNLTDELASSSEDGAHQQKNILEWMQKVINLKRPSSKNIERMQTVIILDRSSSMGSNSAKMVNEVFPVMLKTLGYKNDDNITMITFDTIVECFSAKVGELHKLKCASRGCTNMSGVFKELTSAIHESTSCLRLLTLSDGEIGDKMHTINKASEVATLLKARYNIVSKAVRLFTSQYGQPDTRGLASVLQFNTETLNDSSTSLMDLNADLAPKELANIMANMFKKENFTSKWIESSEAIFLREPWSNEPLLSNRLKIGKNILWLNSYPMREMKLGEFVSLNIVKGDPISHETMYEVLGDTITFYLNQLKLLRVIGNKQSMESSAKIVQYFKNLEESLSPPDDLRKFLQIGSLKNRAAYIRKMTERQFKSITVQMETIANDERVATLNQAQQADYLRQINVTSNAKGLAKRAHGGGLDFDKTARDEVRAIAAHIHELQDVDDDNHAVSFYSQATTKEALVELSILVKETKGNVFESMRAHQLLELFNIVGIPCSSRIGEYPDPMTFRVSELFSGYYLSVADLTVAAKVGGALSVPGTSTEINNVIPIFECSTLQAFLQKYAPTMMEYCASVGMRRMIANVPRTYSSSIVSGVWQAAIDLDKCKSEVNIKVFGKMANSLDNAMAKTDYLLTLLKSEQCLTKSHFLDHNGIAAIMTPLLRLVRLKETQLVPRILRALYSFEFYSVIKKMCKGKDDVVDHRGCMLDDLLGIDYKKHGTPLPPLFSSLNPDHYDKYEVSDTKLAEFEAIGWYIKYATLLVPFFDATFTKNCDSDVIEAFQQVQQLNEKNLVQYLGINFPYKKFLLYNVVEGLLYTNKQSRIDKETNLPLLPDLGVEGGRFGDEMIKNLVQSRYEIDYKARLKFNENQEQVLLRSALVKQLLSTGDIAEFLKLLQNGIKIKDKSYTMTSLDSPGIPKVMESLLTFSKDESTGADLIPLRLDKLLILYKGKDAKGKVVWNNGNVCKLDLSQLKQVLINDLNQPDKWNKLIKYIRSQMHMYRKSGKKNRHGHSNDNPSWFGLGYKSLEDLKTRATPEMWNEYKAKHGDC